MIAFRGTENRPLTQFYYDWGSNIAAALGFEPRQYTLVQEQLPLLLAALRREFGSIPIYAVGHSLGGGLAQQAGYLSVEVTEVFAFNTSPVTNWTGLRAKRLVEREYPIIHRISHTAEILEKARFISTATTSARYGRDDVGIVATDRSVVGESEHGIDFLACTWAALVAVRSKTRDSAVPANANHHFGPEFAASVFASEHPVQAPCPPSFLKRVEDRRPPQ